MAPDLGTSFLAVQLSEANSIPPDSMGSVGPTQVLVHVNGRVKVFDKGGVLGALNATDDAFWASVSGGQGLTDPEVEYDRLSGRWVLSMINAPASGANRIMIAVSSGSTITDATSFTFFQFQQDQVGTTPNVDTGGFADYPQMGVDKFALYIGVNMFNASDQFTGTTGFVVDKADLISGMLTVTAFRGLVNFAPSTDTGPLSPQGVQNQDPAATEGYFIGVDAGLFSRLVIRRVSDPGGTPSISGDINLTVPTTTFPMGGVPQPSGPDLDDLDDRLYAAMIARNPAGQLRLWTAHNIEVNSAGVASMTGNRDGSRWYEIGNLTGSPTLIQAGTLFHSASTNPFSYWIPSIAANGQGHAVIGTSRASASAANGGHASIAVAERLVTDPLGTLAAPVLAQSSTFNYDIPSFPGTERWGDYSQTVIDPTDNMTFWTFQEYANATNSWGVRVIEVMAPPPATPSSASPATIPPGDASETVVITGTSTQGSGFFDPGPDTGGPGFLNDISATVSGGVTVNSITYNSPTQVTLDLSTVGAPTGLKTVTITNPDGQSEAGAILTVGTPDTTPPTAFDLVAPADGATLTTSSPTFSWTASMDPESGIAKYQLFIDGSLNKDNISSATTSTTPVAPIADGLHTWRIRAVNGDGLTSDSSSQRSFIIITSQPTATQPIPLGPKAVSLKSKPRKLGKGDRTRLTAIVSPCAGHEGDLVEFYRKGKLIAEKASNASCVAKHKVKVKKTTRFRAVSPQQDADHLAGRSNAVKVKVTRT